MAVDAGGDATTDVAADVPTDLGTPDVEVDAPEDMSAVDPVVLIPRMGTTAEDLALVVNDDDPQSVAVTAAYQAARGIPDERVVHVNLPLDQDVLSPEDFEALGPTLDAIGDDVQALALTWTRPYRVGCMSITSAFALGFDRIYCNTTGGSCGPTARVDSFNTSSTRMYTDLGIRPTMMLAGTDADAVQALIERGVASDDTFPAGDGYLIRTTDSARSVRYMAFARAAEQWDHEGGLSLTYIDNADGSGSNVLQDTVDVMFYWTGQARIADIETNTYLPGAIADHLTSFGGRVPTAGGQMSVVEWLSAGATGSFGTTVEPCNYQQKFPSVELVLEHYFRGEPLIDAYWKSVQWPGEGLFVGEPLARPYGEQNVTIEDDMIVIETNAIVPGETWSVESSDSEEGPWTFVMDASTDEWRRSTVRVPRSGALVYRLSRPE